MASPFAARRAVWHPFGCQHCLKSLGGCDFCGGSKRGPQWRASASGVYRLLYGGAAFGGKSAWLVAEALRSANLAPYRALILRESLQDARDLIDKARELYRQLPQLYSERGGWNGTRSEFTFRSGAKVRFGYLRNPADIHHYDGPGFDDLFLDELVHFQEQCVRELLARARPNVPGRRVRIRCTSNPPRPSEGKWVRDWWAPWLQRKTYPWPAKPGEIRYYLNTHDADGNPAIAWLPPGADWRPFVAAHCNGSADAPKLRTATFIPATVLDNPIGVSSGYAEDLKAQSYVRYLQLALGDWEAEYSAGNVFRSDWWGAPLQVSGWLSPALVRCRVRYWDRAGTEPNPANPDPDWTAGVLLALTTSDQLVVEDVIHARFHGGLVDDLIGGVAGDPEARTRLETELRRRRLPVPAIDPPGTLCAVEEDPGQAGKAQAEAFLARMRGFRVAARAVPARSRGGKLDRADAASASVYHQRVRTVAAEWRQGFLAELAAFPPLKDGQVHDDQVDAFTGAHDLLEDYRRNRRFTLGRDR